MHLIVFLQSSITTKELNHYIFSGLIIFGGSLLKKLRFFVRYFFLQPPFPDKQPKHQYMQRLFFGSRIFQDPGCVQVGSNFGLFLSSFVSTQIQILYVIKLQALPILATYVKKMVKWPFLGFEIRGLLKIHYTLKGKHRARKHRKLLLQVLKFSESSTCGKPLPLEKW